MKKLIVNIIKFLIAGGLIYWLINSGKLDINAFKEFFNTPQYIAIGIALYLVSLLINTFRWQNLIETVEKQRLNFLEVFKFGWMGLFFNIALPGSVSGDLIKVLLLKKKYDALSGKRLLLTVLLDRVFGLSALVIIMGLISVFNYKTLTTNSEVAFIINANLLIFFFYILGLLFLFTTKEFKQRVVNALPLKSLHEKLFSLLEITEEVKLRFPLYIGLSLCSQGIFVFTFYFLTKGEVPFLSAISAIPVGFIALAIPIAPGGLGVGHALFQGIFSAFGISKGAVFFNNYFLLVTLANITGAIPYVLSDNSTKELMEEAEAIQ